MRSLDSKMELKDYQKTVISDLEVFLEYLDRYDYVGKAFNMFWQDKGVRMDAYKHVVKGVPNVCVKVPTAGGKTFIAVNALRPIFESFEKTNPGQTKVVVWLVPSITILNQTIDNLRNPAHPYSLKLRTHFNGRVEVFDKNDVLQGIGFSGDTVREQLSVIVLSFDSLRARNKDDRKLYQDNPGGLMGFEVEGEDVSVISVLQSLRPVVIVDESHNAETELSIEMLQNLNPSFILDLTATPRNNSNIISYVSAAELKKNNMVKLPVVVQNQKDKTDVLANALNFQRQLEAMARKEEAEGGSHIRPIVLFQAEPRNAEDAETFDGIKDKLLKLGIPESNIAIKTATKNELKGVDLLSRECEIRYIITVNALKEGWDCPFAYILASLANKGSAVDVEQILGRILRQPSVKRHNEQLLNLSYVFTASGKFLKTLDNIVKGLQNAGFSNRDYREIEAQIVAETPNVTQNVLFPEIVAVPTAEEESQEIDLSAIDLTTPSQILEELKEKALEVNEEFEKKVEEGEFQLPLELESRTNMQPMKEVFSEIAGKLLLPQFFMKLSGKGGFFNPDIEEVIFNSDELLTDFRLSQSDATIDFEGTDTESYFIDLEEVSKDDYKPVFRRMNHQQVVILNEKILSLPEKSKIEAINQRFCKLIGNMYPIPDKEIKAYIGRILEQMTAEQLKDCLERDFVYSLKIKRKITSLTTAHKEKKFSDCLDTDKITIKPAYILPQTITPSTNAPAVQKSLYVNENSMSPFETRVINSLAGMENVVFWHKIIEKKGFKINGFINHYPDFLILTKSGKVILVEAKGDHLDNSDSTGKLKLGNLWASKAGNEYRYFMVFDNNPIDNAHRVDEAANLIAQI